jgi:hypothetical protein
VHPLRPRTTPPRRATGSTRPSFTRCPANRSDGSPRSAAPTFRGPLSSCGRPSTRSVDAPGPRSHQGVPSSPRMTPPATRILTGSAPAGRPTREATSSPHRASRSSARNTRRYTNAGRGRRAGGCSANRAKRGADAAERRKFPDGFVTRSTAAVSELLGAVSWTTVAIPEPAGRSGAAQFP